MATSRRLWEIEQKRKIRERQRRAKRRRNCTIFVFVAAIVAVIIIVARGCSSQESSVRPENTDVQKTEAPLDSAASVQDTGVMTTPQPGMEFVASVSEEELDLSCFDNAAFIGNALGDTVSMYNVLPATDFYTGVNIDLENVYTTAAGYSSTPIADQLKSKKFSRVFLCFGEHELAWKSASKFGGAYHDLIDKVKEYQPSASIYLISIPPVTKSVSDANTHGINLTSIKEYNRRIRNLAYSESLYYVDSVAALGRGGGYLMDGASYDGINLNKEYIIELMNYIDKKSYIPNTPASSEPEENSDDEDEPTDEPTDAPDDTEQDTADGDDAQQDMASDDDDEPKPTVNVFKDSSKYN